MTNCQSNTKNKANKKSVESFGEKEEEKIVLNKTNKK